MGEIHERLPLFVHFYGRNPRAYTMVRPPVWEKSTSVYHGLPTCMGEIHERISWFVRMYGRYHGLSICTGEIHELKSSWIISTYRRKKWYNYVFTLMRYTQYTYCDFQQCGILTCVYSDEPVQPPFKLRNSK